MINKYKNQILKLTQYILEEYWKKNPQPLLSHLHKNIMWIGSTDSEYVHGSEEMQKRVEENSQEMPLVYLDEQEYGVVHNEANSCVVAGRYRAFTKPESGLLLSEKQRVTFVWTREHQGEKAELKIKHIHLSNVLHMQGEEERFPTKAGRETYQYVQKMLAERSRGEVISVKDSNKVNRMINYSDIMYIRSDRNYICMYLANAQGEIRVRGNLSTFMQGMPEDFITVSRSYGINRSYVKTVQAQKLVMVDDTQFQIPAAVCASVKKAINRNSEIKK